MEFEIIDIDDDEFDFDDDQRNVLVVPRNARVLGRSSRDRGRSRGRERGGRGRERGGRDRGRGGRIQLGGGRGRSSERAPIVRDDTGGLSTGELVNAAAQVLAAMTSLPPAPAASGDPAKDIANLIEYQSLLAQHAKRDEQFRTVGSLASKFFV